MDNELLLNIDNLVVKYHTDDAVVHAVNGLDLSLKKGETIGLVGETGAGKTTTALAIMGLLDSPPAKIEGGSIIYKGQDLVSIKEAQYQDIRGNEISMIFQDPMTALNPVMTVIEQIAEVYEKHQKLKKDEAKKKAEKMLELVRIPVERAYEYPSQFSGGMKQRIVIAIALACNPMLLIADEPTTALDVTIQAQVLEMMRDLRDQLGTSMIMITHDFGIVAEICDYVSIMYAGEVVENGSLRDIFKNAKHPYTIGLFGAIPKLDEDVEFLNQIDGLMPDPTIVSKGCPFAPRCIYAEEFCFENHPEKTHIYGDNHSVSCHIYSNKLNRKSISEGGEIS